ncbi:MAG: trypsin-like peptidase domain-containing protein [Herbiconiux sp.]|nr:trypsin-like peptidase domain-containing protein [Herbiconiux sp.]
MNDTARPELPPFPATSPLIAHTHDGPLVFEQLSREPQPPRRDRRAADRRRRRRTVLVAGAAGFAIIAGIAGGGTAFALNQGTQTVAAGTGTGETTVVENWGSPSGDGTALGGPASGTTGTGTGLADTSTPAVAASAAQTAGVVTIVSDLTYQGARSAGTGVILTSDGLVLTNNHVIEGSTQVEVTDELTGESFAATVVGTDATHDIAVLQLQDAAGLTPATLGDSDTLAAGDAVTAVGNAEGTGDLVAASGTVTALEQTITTQSEAGTGGETLDGLIRIDADIVSGDSGGPLLNAAGEVVGIDTAASSGSADIVGFAIPLSDALDIVSRIANGVDTDTVEIGYPGFLGIAVAADGTRAVASGATVAGVIPGTPAETAGLSEGDLITAVNGTPIASGSALSALLATLEPGEQVTLTVTPAATGAPVSVAVVLTQGPAA